MKHFSTQFEVLTFTLSDGSNHQPSETSFSVSWASASPNICVRYVTDESFICCCCRSDRKCTALGLWPQNLRVKPIRAKGAHVVLDTGVTLHHIDWLSFAGESPVRQEVTDFSPLTSFFLSLSHPPTRIHTHIHTYVSAVYLLFSTDHRVTVNEWLVFHILGFRGLTELMASLACSSVLDWQLQFPQWSRVDGWWWKWWVDGVLVTFCILRHAILHYSINVSLILLHSDKLRVMMMPDHYWKA